MFPDEDNERRHVDTDVRPALPEAVLHHVRDSDRHLPDPGHLPIGLLTCEYERSVVRLVQLRARALSELGEYKHIKFQLLPTYVLFLNVWFAQRQGALFLSYTVQMCFSFFSSLFLHAKIIVSNVSNIKYKGGQ